MKRIIITVILTLTLTAFAIQAVEQTAFSGAGVIHSTVGGFMFPDGSVQASAAFPAASTCTAITYLPYTIIYEGVYCFTGNLSDSRTPSNAITIEVDNVTINMNGWKLDGLGAGAGTETTGIYAYQRKNITIRNGTIRGFLYGIHLDDSSPYTTSQGHLIEDIRADMNTYIGLWIEGSGNIVRRNQIVATGGSTVSSTAYGIVLYGPGGRILNNDISSTAAWGSYNAYGLFLSGQGAVVESNRIIDVSSGTGKTYGIYFNDSFDGLTVGNRISYARYGIYHYASDSKYMDNLTGDIIGTPFFGGTAVGTNN